MLSFVAPNGQRAMLVVAPAQAGLTGGEEANVSPAMAQSIEHATAVIVNGGCPASKTGDGSEPEAAGDY